MSRPALRRLFLWLTVAETVTLAILIVNLITAHRQGITASVGPIHGILYVACIAVVLVIPGVSARTRLMTVIPALGAPAAWWMLSNDQSGDALR